MVEVYQRAGSPFWYFDLVDPLTGKRQRKSTRETGKRKAQAVAERHMDTLKVRAASGGEPLTLEVAVNRYIGTISNPTTRSRFQNRAARLMGRMVLKTAYYIDPAMRFEEVTSVVVSKLVEARRNEGYAQNTINGEIGLIQATYNHCKSVGVLVAKDVEFPLPRVKGKLCYLTRDEEARFLAELDPDRAIKSASQMPSAAMKRRMQDVYDLAVFLLDTGCRYSEAAGITWDMLDTLGWTWVDVYRSKTDTETRLMMTPRLRAVLQRRRTLTNGTYVFPGWDGMVVDETKSRGYQAKAIKRALDRAGCNAPHLVKRRGTATCHTLRDTFASRLVEAGMSIYKVSKLLGHASVVQTQKYAKLEPGGPAAEAAEILGRMHAAT
jgi:integrase